MAVPKLLPITSLLILGNLYGNMKSVELFEIAIEKMSQKLPEKKGEKLSSLKRKIAKALLTQA